MRHLAFPTHLLFFELASLLGSFKIVSSIALAIYRKSPHHLTNSAGDAFGKLRPEISVTSPRVTVNSGYFFTISTTLSSSPITTNLISKYESDAVAENHKQLWH